ncbi:hypothetical protein FHS10_005112 [Mucilaginibacter dorajii]|nr:hypothetical protein [Mucilaginibacter dorajii]
MTWSKRIDYLHIFFTRNALATVIASSYLLPMTGCKTEIMPNVFRAPTGQVTRMMYT